MHSQKQRRYKCNVCQKAFTESKGTVFYRLHSDQEVVTQVITLLAHGCPEQAIVKAFGLDERTVRDWQRRAGEHSQQVHEHLVEQPRDLGQVQADEIRVKMQGLIVWLALAIQVSTRLWLGGEVSEHRDRHLLRALLDRVRRCALCRPLLFCVDGCQTYLTAIRHAFRERIPGPLGRPRLRPWDDIAIAQVIKRYARKHVVDVTRHIVQGTASQIASLLQTTQGAGVINTAYIERLNATFRSRMVSLVRRGRALARQIPTLHYSTYLIGSVYNFCTYHQSLRLPLLLPHGRRRWLRRTPAIAAGITDHCWSVHELLSFHVPPPRWSLPKRIGRFSNATLALAAQWCA